MEVKRWMNSVDYATRYDEISKRVYEETGKWLLQHPAYCKWKTAALDKHRIAPSSQADAWLERVLFFKAKPGFGKSYLSVALIDDLAGATAADQDGLTVAYFHFDHQNKLRTNSADEALRAVAAQLIRSHQRDRMSIDALQLIRTRTGSGQHTSSRSDVRMVTDVLLRRRPALVLIDGVDECSETERLLEEVRSLSIEHGCRFLLLGRPNVAIPLRWELYVSFDPSVTLDPSLVLSDIASFLRSHLGALVARGLFGPGLRSIDDLQRLTGVGDVKTLSAESEGLFLWAQLFVNLLCSPSLTPRDRLDICRQPRYLRGLDPLYNRMLELLLSSSTASNHLVLMAGRIFRLIAFSLMPLSLEAFNEALAVRVWEPTSPIDYVPDFPSCVPLITCSLVEVQAASNTLSFIHITFRDFLFSHVYTEYPSSRAFGLGLPPAELRPLNWRYIHHPGETPQRRMYYRQGVPHRHHTAASDTYGEALTAAEVAETTFVLFAASPLAVHCEIAEISLTYLLLNVPHEPLTNIRLSDGTNRLAVEASSNTLIVTAQEAETLTSAPTTRSSDTQHFAGRAI